MPTVEWTERGPRSPHFDDIYRCTTDGLSQAREVFMAGCGLPPPIEQAHLPAEITVLETGFGLGLNFLALWQAWRHNPGLQHCRLRFASIEAYPVGAGDLVQSVRAWPELLPLAQELARAWPAADSVQAASGLHLLHFDHGRVELRLALQDIHAALQHPHWIGASLDAIYLDGFAPAKNPDMWSPAVMQGLAQLSHVGTRLATWCVAGDVRRALQDAGFEVTRVPGIPPKRHNIRAVFRGK
jgi:tRNA 5-methylaminomethyl-2-thiouridine biosynthesis bifunctional protein